MNHNLLRGRTDQGLTYHVTSKVNRDAFELEPDDMKQLFLSVIEGAIKKGFKFKLWNFCVMGNHFHFLITPEKGESLSSIMKWIKMVYAIRWNKRHNKTGHFWGDRFFSREIKDERDFWTVFEYIDQNSVAAGLVQKPEDWQYSGAYHREHGIVSIISLVTDTAWRSMAVRPQTAFVKVRPLRQDRFLPRDAGVSALSLGQTLPPKSAKNLKRAVISALVKS